MTEKISGSEALSTFEQAQQAMEWFADCIYGLRDDIDENVPQLTRERITGWFGATVKPQEVLDKIRDVFIQQEYDLQNGLAMYFAGYPDDALEGLLDDVDELKQLLYHSFQPEDLQKTALAKTAMRVPSIDQEQSLTDEVMRSEHDEQDDFAEVLGHLRFDDDVVKQYMQEAGKHSLLTAEQEVEIGKAIEAGLFAAERLDEDGYEFTDEERAELEYLVQQGRVQKELMINSNLRLVVSIAKRYIGRGLGFLDLIQEGNLGLIRAVEKFDYTKGFKFSTYATWWIRQAVTRAMADQARTIRLPVYAVETINRMVRFEKTFLQDFGREPTVAEIASEFGMKEQKVVEFKKASHNPTSLDLPLGEDHDMTFGSLIQDTDSASEVTTHLLMEETFDILNQVLNTFSEREATVIQMRMGLLDGRIRTLAEVGAVLGVTPERARQIEQKTLSKLRHPSRAHMLVRLQRLRDS